MLLWLATEIRGVNMAKRFEMTPTSLRLSRIAQWREDRFQRAMRTGSFETARRAADLYTAAEARANGFALDGSIWTFTDFD